MAPDLSDVIKGTQIDSEGVDDFIEKVSEVSRLIDGLKTGTISPDYVDTKLAAKSEEKALRSTTSNTYGHCIHSVKPQQDVSEDAEAREAAKQAELQRKVAELKANRERKARVRQLYQQHTERPEQLYATDYTKWDLFCPSDEEDELFNGLTPSNPQFKAMERDINDRHSRMVEQRQIAERQRQLGNDAFKAKQYGEALRCYELGLESQKHNMALHANAAMAALKLKCYVQAMEHCDKVLHLAEVLYNTPKHMLCVKALQRRATAYQALGQHSKAVEDLKRAADILPGDKEVSEQLEHAQRLLEEHKSAKKLKGLAATTGSAKVPSAQSPAANASISSLQGIEQLIAALTQPREQPQTGSDTAAKCLKLKGLVQQDDSCGLYFRECGGLDAVIKQVLHSNTPEVSSAALQLLIAACDNCTTLEQLAQQQQLLAAVLDQLRNPEPAVYEAAVELLYTASTAAAVRQELCKQLLARKPGAAAAVAGDAKSRLEVLWASCMTQTRPATDVQALAISLLSNCLLVPTVKEASKQLLSQRLEILDDLIGCLLTNSSRSTATQSALAEKLYGLFSNLSTHPATRRQLADHKQLVAAVLKAALCNQYAAANTNSNSSSRTAAMGLLCNFSLEAPVQQQLAKDSKTLNALLALTCGSEAANSSADSSEPKKAGPQLPDRKQKHAQQQSSMANSAGAAEVQVLQQQRAACLLSRAAKQAAGIQALQGNDALHSLLSALEQHLQQPVHNTDLTKEQRQAQQDGTDCQNTQAAWLEAVVRTMAMLTAQPCTCISCSPSQASAAIRICLALLQSPEVGETTKGNAALVLGHFAGEAQWHTQLRRADAVKVLVDVAYAGKGNASSKNAAIALAKMAKDQVMLDRLRELHGLEIIYQYVRV